MPMPELPKLVIKDAAAWAKWLEKSASTSQGVMLTLAKKGVTTPTSLTYLPALDEALCYGWIDGWGHGIDKDTHCRRMTPRRANSEWSARNVGFATRLLEEGRMKAAGIAAVEAAKKDGRWDAAYAGPRTIQPAAEWLKAVEADAEAKKMWESLSGQNRFIFCHRFNKLKTEAGRTRRLREDVDLLRGGDLPFPQKDAVVKIPGASIRNADGSLVKKTQPTQRGAGKDQVSSEPVVNLTKTRSGRIVKGPGVYS